MSAERAEDGLHFLAPFVCLVCVHPAACRLGPFFKDSVQYFACEGTRCVRQFGEWFVRPVVGVNHDITARNLSGYQGCGGYCLCSVSAIDMRTGIGDSAQCFLKRTDDALRREPSEPISEVTGDSCRMVRFPTCPWSSPDSR